MLLPKILILSYLLVDIIRPGSRVHIRIINAIVFLVFAYFVTTTLGVIFLCAIMFMVSVNDIFRLFKDNVQWIKYLKIALLAAFYLICIYLAVK